MAIVPVSVQELADMVAVFDAYYKDAQRYGAGTGAASYDDFVASKARTDQAYRTSPMTPLFLPLDTSDPTAPQDALVAAQMADNGIKPIFLALVKFLQGQLARDVVLVGTRLAYGQSVAMNDTYVTMTNAGNLPHSTGPGEVGVPVDAVPEAQYVELRSHTTGGVLTVAGGARSGERIFGLTRAGGSVSPDSVEVEFRSRKLGDPVSSSNSYTWEGAQPTSINLRYGFRMALSSADETAFRRVLE